VRHDDNLRLEPALGRKDLDETAMRGALVRDWRDLRDRGALDLLCASMATRQWMNDRGAKPGYVTVDYRVDDGIAAPDGGREAPTLLEHYWSVRTLDGRQDPEWSPALNLNVVHLHAGPLGARHVENALRNALVFHRAAYRQSWFDDPDRARLHVRAVLIGESLGEDADIMAGFQEFQGVQVAAGTFTHGGDGFQFQRPVNKERVWNVGLVNPQATRTLAEELFGSDVLPQRDFRWDGYNDAQVADTTTPSVRGHSRKSW